MSSLITPFSPCFQHTEPATLILYTARSYAKGCKKGMSKLRRLKNLWNSPPEQTREKRLALKCKNAYPLIFIIEFRKTMFISG
jgi:hypothetical protein